MGKSKKKKGTKLTLEYVLSEFKWHVKPLKCKNSKLKEFIKTIDEHEVTISTGIAGSGKTFLALAYALKALEKGEVEKIVLVKSVTTLDSENIGFLPGEISEKLDPFMMSYYGNADKIIGEEARKRLVRDGKLQIQPLAYVRGITIDKSIILIDECLNLTLDTFRSIITRIGEKSKTVIMGDVEQIDKRNKKQSILYRLLELFKDSDIIGTCEFTDDECVRNPIIPKILDQLRTLENN